MQHNKCKYHKLNIFTVFSNHRSTGKLTHSGKHFYMIKAQRNYLQIISQTISYKNTITSGVSKNSYLDISFRVIATDLQTCLIKSSPTPTNFRLKWCLNIRIWNHIKHLRWNRCVLFVRRQLSCTLR